jgi:Kef-type K+ transport system membrane component KefB
MHPIDPANPVTLPLSLLIVFGAAKLFAELFERLGQPGVAGEIVAGILVGPAVLGWIAPTDLLTALGNLGAMFLLFRVGLDVRSTDLLEAGGIATLAATLGVLVQFLLSFGVLIAWGQGRVEAAFVAAALAATSVGITAQVLRSRGLLQTRAARIILAAAVIDDVEGLLLLAVASSMAHGALNLLQLAITAALAIVFTFAVALWGAPSVSRVLPSV